MSARGLADSHSALSRLAGRPLEAAEFSHEASAALGRALAFDGWCLFGLDPATGLRTLQVGGQGIALTAELARNEAAMEDLNRFQDLAVAPRPAGWLSAAHPLARRSFRLHEIIQPEGFHSELRLALRERGRVWGALVLLREDPRRPFDDQDASDVCALAAPLTNLVRTFPVRRLARHGDTPGPGVVMIAPDDALVAVSAEAQQWLDDLVPGGDDLTGAGSVTRVLYDAAHAVRRGDGQRASTSIRTVSGHWLHVAATALEIGQADVVVTMQRAAVTDILPTVAACNLLTARESDILMRLALGMPSKHIARELGLTLLTVNTYLSSMYRKCQVSGREELFGQLT